MYALYNLGWSSFQQLCLTITREILGQTVESFLDSGDGGRDGAFAGRWRHTDQENLSGTFVIQCKYTSKSGYNLQMSDLDDELGKIQKLVLNNLCDSYVLITNAGVSGVLAGKIKAKLKSLGVKGILVLGSTWLNQQILENKRLRMLVPRVYGLGDLSQILDERAYTQARAIIESLREDLAKVVVTESYRKAANALDTHGFVLLVGEPAAGKTTIASLLAMGALDQWQASMLKLDEPDKVSDHWNPDEPSQFFWLDDAFGVTQYEDSLVRRWNHILPQVKTMLRKGAKIVMTSRDYIYNRARKSLKESAFPLLNESQVVIDVHDLTIDEKRQILYNHLKLGKQPRAFLTEIKPYLDDVASHPSFIPETARRLADPLFTKELFVDQYYLRQFVERREQFLKEVLHSLDAASKAALALIYMRNGRLESPIKLQQSETEALNRLDSDLGSCITSLEALRGSLVLYTSEDGEYIWRFKHPTIGDAYAELLAQSPELLEIYIQGSSPDEIVSQVSCGDVGIEKAIVVPKPLFSLMLIKLKEFNSSKRYKTKHLAEWHARWALQDFLSHRCSVDFLSYYLSYHPALLDTVSSPSLYLDSVPEVRLANRLHEFGLLPEDNRKQFVITVSEYTVSGEDLSIFNTQRVRDLFTADEFNELKHKVLTQLLPNLDDLRREYQREYREEEPPEEHMQRLLESMDTLKDSFKDHESVIKAIDQEILVIEDWIVENSLSENDKSPRILGQVEVTDAPKSIRSIFDDIDMSDV